MASGADLGALGPLGGVWRGSRGQVAVGERSFQLSVRNLNLLLQSVQNLEIGQETKTDSVNIIYNNLLYKRKSSK